MSNLNVRVRYRPVRIGWCIRDKNWDDLRRALRLTHILWGGRFNPVIPVGASSAEELVRRFRVDLLMSVGDDPQVKEFIKQFKHLPWPVMLELGLFSGKRLPNFLDITHPLRRIDKPNGILAEYSNQLTLIRWKDTDPLADVLLATFGGYPTLSEIGIDYPRFIRENLQAADEEIYENQEIPSSLLDQRTPSDLSCMELTWDRVPHVDTIGFYVGSVSDFEDIVNFWNLRASDLSVLFLDPSHLDRLKSLQASHSAFIRARQSPSQSNNHIPVWSRSQKATKEAFAGEPIESYWAVDGTHIIQGNFRPPLQYFTQKSAFASLSEQYAQITLTFPLPEKPFIADDEWLDQRFVVSVRPSLVERDEESTFWTPYITELNEWYGRTTYGSASSVRAEVEGIGFICRIRDESLAITSIQKQKLVAKLFELSGIKAQPSVPGRIASRLISQLGGLQGCRVLKVGGVRNLIKQYGPLQDFSRTEAMFTIGNSDPKTGKPRFDNYEGLFIEQRDPSIAKLTPEQVFLYLLDKAVFRVGLTLVCPACELPSWVHLDEIHTQHNCELCGRRFNVIRQLKDRDWKYRRSGLFGQGNNQEGSIPVALTLQQLDTQIGDSFNGSIFLTNLSLTPTTAPIKACETDIFVAVQRGDRIDIALGECKDSGGTIEIDDAIKLAAVADSFPKQKFDVYIIFAKTGTFSIEEIENCRAAQGKGGLRVIMLSARELEPYFVYENTAKEFDIHPAASSLSDMAEATHHVFFAPKVKD